MRWSLLLVLALLGCATRGDVEELALRVQRLGERQTALRRELVQRTAALEASQRRAVEELRSRQAELDARLDQIHRRLLALNGAVEELRHAQASQDKGMREMGQRLEALAKEASGLDKRVSALAEQMEDLGQGLDRMQRQLAVLPRRLNPRSLYRDGLEALRAGRLQEARDLLNSLLELHPHSDYADNALFWIGETYYREGKLDQAALKFAEVEKRYPKGNKVPAALLREARCLERLGQRQAAVMVLRKLIRNWPRAPEAREARSRLKQLGGGRHGKPKGAGS